MRVLVCGSRNFKNKELMEDVLKQWNIHTIIEGEARGADTLAREYAEEHTLAVEAFPARWSEYGRAAGPIRNLQMLTEGKPDLVVAFLSKDSIGTKDMIKQATDYGVEVRIINI